MSEWRDIATAPRDGLWFLICRAGEADSYEVGRFHPTYYFEFVYESDGLYRKEKRLSYEWSGFNNFHSATHWAPLPPVLGSDPPKAA